MGKFNFGTNKNDTSRVVEKFQQPKAMPILSVDNSTTQLIVEVPVEVIKEVEVVREVIKEVPKIEVVEKIIEVIKEVEIPVVVTKIEVVEIEKPVEVIVEKVTKIIDTTDLFEQKQLTRKLEGKIRRLYLALACMIVLSMIMAVK